MIDPRAMRPQAALIAISLVGLFGCDLLKPKIDQKFAEGLVESIFTREGVKPDSISCPGDQINQMGTKFECTATVNGTEVHFDLEVEDDQGTVRATPRDHTLVVSKVEPEIKSDLLAAGHEVKSIDCHGDVWVAIKGVSVTCDVTDERGTAYLWTATFTDDEGGHEHSIAPK
jgi:hypothetical protein